MGNKPGSKRAAYAKAQKVESERIRTTGMLLDATWQGGYFYHSKWVGDHLVYCYYDRDGNVIPRPPERG